MGSAGLEARGATSKSRKRLGVIDSKYVRVFDENFQPVVDFAAASRAAICPTDSDIFVLRNTQGQISTGKVVRYDSNGSYLGSTTTSHGVEYRDASGQLTTVPGLTGTWSAVEPDPLGGSSAWVANTKMGDVVHVDTNGNILQSLGGFGTSAKWLAVMLSTP